DAQTSAALTYCASGELKFQQVVSNGIGGYEEIWSFTLTKDIVGKWKLAISSTSPDKQLPICVINIISCDRTNIYSITYSSDFIDTPFGSSPKLVPKKTESYPAVITAGCYPIDASSAVGVIWLAFCGGDYLDQDKTQTRFPNLLVPDPRRDPGAWDCDLQYCLTGSGKSRLLVAGKYVIQQAYIRNSAIDYPEMDEPMNDNERESFQRTFSRYKTLKAASTITSAYYSDEITNLNGIFIPIRFHADLGLEDVSDYSDRFVGVVTNIVIAETTNLMPPLRGLITVED